jgi:branched-subunit amino acid transport protein AzlD
MSLIKISKRNKIVVSVIATILIFVGYYLAIYKSFSYQSNNDTIGNVLMLISIGVFPMLWLNSSENFKWKKYVYVLPMVIVGIIIIIVTITKKKEYLDEEINKYGKNTVGKVIGFEVGKGRSKTRYATFKYVFKKKQYVQRIENYDDEYKLNQILNVKISERNPEMFKIVKTTKYYPPAPARILSRGN